MSNQKRTTQNQQPQTRLAPAIAAVFRQLSQPTRIEILLAIGEGEACVCHLEAKLRKRQAYISQHLMALRDAGLLTARRDGRFIYYSLTDPALMTLVRSAARLGGIPETQVHFARRGEQPDGCACPNCSPDGAMAAEAHLLPLEEIR